MSFANLLGGYKSRPATNPSAPRGGGGGGRAPPPRDPWADRVAETLVRIGPSVQADVDRALRQAPPPPPHRRAGGRSLVLLFLVVDGLPHEV